MKTDFSNVKVQAAPAGSAPAPATVNKVSKGSAPAPSDKLNVPWTPLGLNCSYCVVDDIITIKADLSNSSEFYRVIDKKTGQPSGNIMLATSQGARGIANGMKLGVNLWISEHIG